MTKNNPLFLFRLNKHKKNKKLKKKVSRGEGRFFSTFIFI